MLNTFKILVITAILSSFCCSSLFAQFTTSGASIVYTTDRVGIGLSAPPGDAILTVQKYGGVQMRIHNSNLWDYARLRMQSGTGTSVPFFDIAAHTSTNANNTKLNFYCNQVGDIMSLRGNGNVGIGTTSPAHKLDVNGTVALAGHPVLTTNPANDDVYGHIRVIRNASGDLQDGMFINYNSTGGSNAHVRFYANGTTERMRINASNGNVGIGTQNPTQNLHIHSNSNYGEPALKFTTAEGSNGAELRYYGDAGGRFDYQLGFLLNNRHVWRLYLNEDRGHEPWMEMPGKIIAKEVEVNTAGWSDFVFEEDYQLRPLKEVAAFIAKHKHLPDVPSEAEIGTQLNVGEMSKIQMQKIEELTLYLIEQQNLLEQQQQQIQQQAEQIAALMDKINE